AWDHYDRDIANFLRLGMNVYLFVIYAPEWSTGDVRTWYPYNCTNRISNEPYLTPLDECNFTQNLDLVAYREFVKTAAERYGAHIKHWGFIGEVENFTAPFNSWPEIAYEIFKTG